MLSTAYPSNFDYSDESTFSHSSQPLFAFDDPWSVGHYEMSVPNDTLPVPSMDGLDAFGEITDDNFFSDEFSSDVMTEDEIVSTPPPSSPLPYANIPRVSDIKIEYPSSCEPDVSVFKSDPYSQMAAQTWQQRQLYLQYQQYQYHVLQQKLLMSALQLPPVSHMYPPSPTAMPVSEPICAPRGLSASTEMPVREVNRPFEDARQHLVVSDAPLKLTNLDASHFGTNIAPYPKLKSIPVDISGNLSDAQYNKIFKKYHLHLQLDSHPTVCFLPSPS
jgi:hypothetical protein